MSTGTEAGADIERRLTDAEQRQAQHLALIEELERRVRAAEVQTARIGSAER